MKVKRVEGLLMTRSGYSRARSIFDRVRSPSGLVALATLLALAGLLLLRRERARAGLGKVTGKAKEAWGRRRGDVALELEGQAEQVTAELEQGAAEATEEQPRESATPTSGG